MRTLIVLFLATALSQFATSRTAEEVKPLLIGNSVPKVDVADEAGKTQFLPVLTKGKHSIIVFYRGGWCPYCNTHLQELAAAEKDLIELGYQIIALSPDSPQMLSTVEKDGDLGYSLYSDSGLDAAAAFGIDFTLSKETLQKYKEYGIDLAENSGGKNKDRLPVPSVFIVTPDNRIALTYVNPEIRDRIPGDLLKAAARAIAGK